MYDPQKIEKKWQKVWNKEKVFEGNPKSSEKKKFITVPYPYASGPMHIGHGRSYVNGDIFARYYRAKGYNVLFPIAFHVTGTPVLAISSRIRKREVNMETQIREYIKLHTKDPRKVEKLLKSFVDPERIVDYFSNTMKQDLKSIGNSMDFRRTFSTADIMYNKFIEWQFTKLYKKGYIEKGKYPILYCPNCENATGEDDIQGGDEKNLGLNEFIGVKFPFEEGFLVAATLRPETLFGVTNIWVNPNGIYVKAKVDGEIWIISEKSIFILRHQNREIEIIEKLKGSDLVGKKISHVFNEKELLILPALFVDTSAATGVVYSVPAHAPYDYMALNDLKENEILIEKYNLKGEQIKEIKPIKIIDLEKIANIPAEYYIKKYNIANQEEIEKLDEATNENYKEEYYHGVLNRKCDAYQGKEVSLVVDEIITKLMEERMAIKVYMPITKGLKCRCGANIIVSILNDQWFINFNAGKWKERAKVCLDNMKIVPEKYRLNFKHVFEWLDKRPCARKRGLGTKFPLDKNWIIESLSDSTIYMAFYTIVHILKSHKIDPSFLTEEVFDFIFLNKGFIEDLAKKNEINENVLIKMKQEFDYWYPVDQRHTAIMHISNHLSFFIFHHVAIFPERYWPKCITLIEPVIIEGKKMGKSKGNVISLAEIKRDYSADLFRFYISQSADLGVKLDWRKKRINTVQKHITNFFTFVEEVSNDFEDLEYNYKTINSNYSKAILSSCLKKFQQAEKALGEYKLREYLQQSFYEVFRILREYRKFTDNKQDFSEVMKILIPNWIKLLSPTIPHICEELWRILGLESLVSTELWDNFNSELINENLEKEYNYIEDLVDDINQIKKILGDKKIKTIYIYTAEAWKNEINTIISENKGEFKEIIKKVKKVPGLIEKKGIIPFIKNQIKKIHNGTKISPKIEELEVLRVFKPYMENRLKVAIKINSNHDPEGRVKKAVPQKPAIYIETE